MSEKTRAISHEQFTSPIEATPLESNADVALHTSDLPPTGEAEARNAAVNYAMMNEKRPEALSQQSVLGGVGEQMIDMRKSEQEA